MEWANAFVNLGVGGFSILVMWWMYQHSSKRIDERDQAMRSLEKEVRSEIMSQLNKNTTAFDRVIDHLGRS